MALGTVVRDVYTDSERLTMHKTLNEMLGNNDWSSAGIYCYWDPDTHEALYIGLAKDLPARFAQHNSLKGIKPNSGNKGQQINDWFSAHPRLGFSIVIQEGMADDARGRYTEIAEGQLIEGYRALHDKFPPWNKISGSKDGAKYAGQHTGAWFDFMTGKVDGLIVARRTIRELNDDATADYNECTIHTSRTGLTLHPHDGTADDAGILDGVRRMAAAIEIDPLQGDRLYVRLRDYLRQPAPHPESSSS
jgi:hypothetical protein